MMSRKEKSTCPGRQMLSRPLSRERYVYKTQPYHMVSAGGMSSRE